MKKLKNLPKGQETQELEKIVASIFVDNDALAFFDVESPINEPTDVKEIEKKSTKMKNNRPYNFSIEYNKTHYFTTDDYKGRLWTVSVTSPCIVLGAYTVDEDRLVKSSGVYHAASITS